MTKGERNFDDHSYEAAEDSLLDEDPGEEDIVYFLPEESKPPHY